MPEKFNLHKLLEEIKEDEETESSKIKIVSQNGIKKLIHETKKKRKDSHD